MRRAGEPVRAMEGGGSTSNAYKQNKKRLKVVRNMSITCRSNTGRVTGVDKH